METTKNTQIETLLNGLFDLNDFNGNEGILNDLERIFIGFTSSLECDEMEGRERANITFFYMRLKKLLEESNGLTKEDISLVEKSSDNIDYKTKYRELLEEVNALSKELLQLKQETV